jgi:Pyruvate/2-oxoacid:ferredoxin oxidoreductase delta subunit
MWLQRLKPLFILMLILLPLLSHHFFPPPSPPPFDQTSALLPFPLGASAEPSAENPDIYLVYDGDGKLLGYSSSNTALGIKVSGYGGEMELVVGVDPEARISGVVVLGNAETPSYLEKVLKSAAFAALTGKNIADEFVVGKDLDGVSRATISWQAIALGSKQTAALISSLAMKKEIAGGGQEGFPLAMIIKLVVVLLVFVGAFTIARLKPERLLYRYFSVIAFTILVAVIWGTFLSLQNLAYLLMGNPQPLTKLPLFYLLLILTLVSSLLFGRVYCGYLCPLGLVMDIAYRLKLPRAQMPPWAGRVAGSLKYVLLLLVVLLCLFSKGVTPAGWEPFTILYLSGIKLAVVLLTVIIFIGALFYPYLWCRFLCGTGALIGAGAGFSPRAVRINQDCNRCQKCLPVCPVQAISAGDKKKIPHIDPTVCLRCSDCFRLCPKKAISA